MLKYAKIENEETKEVSVALGTNTEFYKSLGMNELDVEKGKDGRWYLTGYAPQPSIVEVKETKLNEINADEIANRNIEGLALVLESGESTLFRAYDNSFHQVTKEQLETMRREIVLNSQRLYQIKWQIEAVIEAAQTVDELDAIDITIDTVAREEGEGHGQTA